MTQKANREPSADNLAGPSKPPRAKPRKSASPDKPNIVFKTPDDPIPIVDFRTETSPKRMNAEKVADGVGKSTAASQTKPLRHNKSSSSIIPPESIDGTTKTTPSSSRVKPTSVASRVSQTTYRSHTPASESNVDNASIADSVADSNSISTSRIKRTEAERKQYFENDQECGSFEAHQAECTRCKKWIRLSTKQTYCIRPWEQHRARCDQRVPTEPTYKNLGLVATLPFVVPRTEKVRKALLELDDTAGEVELEQIKCKTCQQWVPLEKKYSVKDWATHKSACNNNMNPSDLEKTLERKLYFLCDPQFKSFLSPHSIECVNCDQIITLNPEVDYDIERWVAHKKICQSAPDSHRKSSAFNRPSEAASQAQPDTSLSQDLDSSKSAIPETQTQQDIPKTDSKHTSNISTTDSELTLVPPSSSTAALPASTSTSPAIASSPPTTASAPASSNSLKRKREPSEDQPQSSEDVDMDEERPSQRPRTEGYIPVEKDSPSGLGWFLLPFKAFVKGFKESLTTLDS
ncbi:hypothetical protein NP233_g8743 [Leucocoprinus birnbaumii]|uniref:Uncharacterized protein n=1 Tax=Leucocoprinus birnbaumii TaxID=56174 RepID=A0AAD5YTK1_9AGAR|nr:hypothetical protein NP233_g8743 [Leucocoprinus birnbaumii]